jgi:eukaryotic-like serine/threonine-protein kinase
VEERVGRYLFRSRIGSGSGGTVYLALEPDLERWVAVKQLAPELASDAGSLQRFREEAQTMARLNHPNCVRVFDFFEQDGNSYLVSEFVDGASLREVLQEAKELTPQQALGGLKGALMGLGHAHSLGLVHRDIKPENLLCDRQGTSKAGRLRPGHLQGLSRATRRSR